MSGRRPPFFFSALFCSLSLAACPAWALRLVPFGAEFDPRGPGATRTFRIDNDTDQPAAVQVSMVHREPDIDGREHPSDAEDDFVVFPSQLVLLPNEGRTVRVQWLGDSKPAKELNYRIVVEQLPVELDTKSAGGAHINLLLRYEGAVYIVPPGAKGNLVVEAAEAITEEGTQRLAVTVENQGPAHTPLVNVALTLRARLDGATLTLAGDQQLKGLEGGNLLAGYRRRFILPWPAGLPFGPVDATLTLGGASDAGLQ